MSIEQLSKCTIIEHWIHVGESAKKFAVMIHGCSHYINLAKITGIQRHLTLCFGQTCVP